MGLENLKINRCYNQRILRILFMQRFITLAMQVQKDMDNVHIYDLSTPLGTFTVA